MAGALIFNSSTLATGANADSDELDVAGSGFVMLFITSDKALTGVVKVSPLSKAMDGTAPLAADYYPLGSSIAISANTPFAQQIAIGGAATLKINLANASGNTATVKVYARPTVRLIGR